MNGLLNILITAIRARILPIWAKVRLWFSPGYIKAQVLTRIRMFFASLLDVKPRHKQDYYSVFAWLISKRLAFALVVALSFLSLVYLWSILPQDFFHGKNGGIPTYKYRAIPLKFHSGPVKILARGGYLAYEGQVEDGAANGDGVLYNAQGNTVYTGEFANNMYNGIGTLYYPHGVAQYEGSFTDNLFNGEGRYYRDNGILEYSGNHANDARSGLGTLYNSVGKPVFRGNFLNNEIIYPDFLARPTQDVATLYQGETVVYQSAAEYCVSMPEIDAVYSVKDGSNTLENEWTVDRIYVMRNAINVGETRCENVRQLLSELGDPLYFGTAWVNLPEVIAWNELAKDLPDRVERINVIAEQGLENVYAVSAYDQNFQIYLYTFEKSGLLYTFYFTGAGESEFIMYAIEKA